MIKSTGGGSLNIKALKRENKLNYGVFLVVLLLFGILAWGRNIAWIYDVGIWTNARGKSPFKARVIQAAGIAYLKEGRFDEAEAAFRTALWLGQELSASHDDMGLAYYKQGRTGDAIAEYSIASGIRRGFPILHDNIGLTYYKQGRIDDAIGEYLTAIKDKPDDSIAHKNLGVAYDSLGRLDEAIKEYGIALASERGYGEEGHDAGIHYARGNAYAKKGLFNEAIEDYEYALKAVPGHAQARNNLALSNLELGRLDMAEDELKKVIGFYPAYVDAHYNIGRVYAKKGMLEEALAHFEKAAALDPGQDKARRAIQEIKGAIAGQGKIAPAAGKR